LFKFEKAFEAIKKNDKNYKFFLKKYNSRKPKREVGTSEHVGSISIFDSKKDREKDDLQQHQERLDSKQKTH
jgi:hypothetical protein